MQSAVLGGTRHKCQRDARRTCELATKAAKKIHTFHDADAHRSHAWLGRVGNANKEEGAEGKWRRDIRKWGTKPKETQKTPPPDGGGCGKREYVLTKEKEAETVRHTFETYAEKRDIRKSA